MYGCFSTIDITNRYVKPSVQSTKAQPFNERKWKNPDADLLPDKPAHHLLRNTTDWRKRNGKTRKARSQTMQRSMASIFSTTKVILPKRDQDILNNLGRVKCEKSASFVTVN